jgi:hypothetical protein
MTRNIRLGWKWPPVTNTLSYNTTALIMKVKTCITPAPVEYASRLLLLGAPLGWDLTMTRNIRLGWKGRQVTNTLAYNTVSLIMEVKTFIPQAPVDYASRLALIGAPLGWAPTMTRNIRIGWKCTPMTNTLAYNTASLIMEVKTFITEAPVDYALSIVLIATTLG